ncbi:hypothetical protein GCM10022419_010760 [Nonomuraea rosea]|uniref:Lipoprotein n=1 Tax=Nonomuraea rosea TaxID=638574 RepID=A0ABP6VG35_9ACTN
MGHAVRRWAAILGTQAVLAACVPTTPASGGQTGLTLNAEGRLTMAVAWCDQAPDGVIVYRRSGGELLDQAELKGPALSGKIAFVDLEELPEGWSLTEGDLNLRAEESYEIAAFKSGRQLVYFSVNLKEGHKSRLDRDHIVVQRHDTTEEGGHDVELSEAAFMAQAVKSC